MSRVRNTSVAAVVAAATLATAPLALAPAQASGAAGGDPADGRVDVVSAWNAVADRTIFTEALLPPPAATLYLGFVHAAVYNAVVTIEGGYEQYVPQPRPDRHASPEAAAVVAAYRVLRHYFPDSADALAADRSASFADIAPGPVRHRGVLVGRAAAAAIIALRADDGRDADIMLDVDEEPGVWRPTPDGFTPMLVPWLGFVDPMVLRRPTQFAPAGPDPITSVRYAQDLREVRDYGALNGSLRDAWQTQTALFYSDNVVRQYQAALREQAASRGLGLVDSARMFALVDVATADAAIGCWRSKYDRAYWRPVTAIREADTDGNPLTEADPSWTSLLPTPPYPDYVSGHACVTGTFSEAIRQLFGDRDLGLSVSSAVTGTTREYARTGALEQQARNARIWLGFHFRRAMLDGSRLGHDVAAYTARHFFRPTG